MEIENAKVLAISNGWYQAHYALTEGATNAGDDSGTWSPTVSSSVHSFAEAWRTALGQLAAEAHTTAESLTDVVYTYQMTDDNAAALMQTIQRSKASE